MLTMNDIDRKVTEIAGKMIAEGWVIDLEASAGHQGEVGKLFLVKGNQLTAIIIESKSEFSSNLNVMVLSVKIWDYPAEMRKSRTVWLNEFHEAIENHEYYVITRSNKHNECILTESLDEYKEIIQKRDDRFFANRVSDVVRFEDPKYYEIGTKYVKRVFGLKRVSWDKMVVRKDISKDGNKAFYRIAYNHDICRLH